ncbi:rhodanese/cell cycle control phosphatase superfamily protein [Actinidia rufa]|uniref:Rhodanese/cell cycle control phosphatase superfamily protein n=1 Tax=Actinidia rufa TaxID=165716 RepID=A0A7J0E457_9ERIC|nr:rhodanese/cell cycle control phosphatase superfamily protein [Actinidia rufa]
MNSKHMGKNLHIVFISLRVVNFLDSALDFVSLFEDTCNGGSFPSFMYPMLMANLSYLPPHRHCLIDCDFFQTIYRRIASYEDAEDFKQDVRQLLAPLRLGGQAISWAAGKLETNGIGLPTSPSSSDVQNRVLQAAAKHESQPSDR